MRIASVEVPRTAVTLLCTDIVIVAAVSGFVFHLISALWGAPASESSLGALQFSTSNLLSSVLFVFIILTTNFAMGLYQRRYLNGRAVIQSVVLSAVISLAIWALLDNFFMGNKTYFGLLALEHFTMFALMAFMRPAVCFYYANFASKKRLVLVGSQAMSDVVQSLLSRVSPPEFEVVHHYSVDCAGPRETLDSVIKDVRGQTGVDEIVVELNEHQVSAMELVGAERAFKASAPLTSQTALIEKSARWTDIETTNYLAEPGLSRKGHKLFWMKRVFDTSLALAGLIFVLPVLIVTSLAIKLEDGGSLFYTQERVGKDGRVFSVFKFRSMVENAEADGKATWAKKGDNRVTRVGDFIRKSRIDELPQLINIIRGDMSLVGPRPERPEIVEMLKEKIPNYDDRHIIRPGLSGWAQINYPYGASIEDAVWKTKFDMYYIRKWTIWLDFAIIFQTIRVVLLTEGSR
jgi:exopolysaccharide biosynthesis polyprenyl glycosylphosphotransferase